MTVKKLKLLRWLDEAPGRRLTFRRGVVLKVELGGDVAPGPDLRDIADELGKAHLLAPAGLGWWKISPAGIRLVNSDEAPAPPGKPHAAPGAPPPERRCVYVFEDDDRKGKRCNGWNRPGRSQYCSHHPPPVRWRKAAPAPQPKPKKPETGLELPSASAPTPLLPAVELRTLPELPAPRKKPGRRRKCHHGLVDCPACEEAERLDALIGQRLRAAAAKAAIERADENLVSIPARRGRSKKSL